jgi:hypothetical protein
MNTSLEIVTNGTYILTFRYCARHYSGIWFTNHILRVTLNGQPKDEFTVTAQSYKERIVELGELTPGSYTLSISGDGSQAADPCTLIDLVSVSGTTGFKGVELLSNENWHLSVDAQGQIALNYSGLVTMGSFAINGELYSGVYVNAATHPGLVTGSGTLRIHQSGMIFILR